MVFTLFRKPLEYRSELFSYGGTTCEAARAQVFPSATNLALGHQVVGLPGDLCYLSDPALLHFVGRRIDCSKYSVPQGSDLFILAPLCISSGLDLAQTFDCGDGEPQLRWRVHRAHH